MHRIWKHVHENYAEANFDRIHWAMLFVMSIF